MVLWSYDVLQTLTNVYTNTKTWPTKIEIEWE